MFLPHIILFINTSFHGIYFALPDCKLKLNFIAHKGKPSEKMGRKATGRNPINFGSAAGLLSDIITSAAFLLSLVRAAKNE